MVSHLNELGLIEARAYTQTEVFAAGVQFARTEGIVPAPEANHAVKARSTRRSAAARRASRRRSSSTSAATATSTCRRTSTTRPGKLEDHAYSEEEVAMALAGLPAVAA